MNGIFNIMNLIIIIIVQLLYFSSSNIEARKMKTNTDFVFPTTKRTNILFPAYSDFNFPKDDDKEPETVEYNVCQRYYSNEINCEQFANTNNGKWWKPKPENKTKKPPKGYSGYRANHFADYINTNVSNGEREKRKSELRYKEYIDDIYGDGNYNENKILTPEQLNGREIADPGQFPHVAAIGFKLPDKAKVWECAGSLLSENFVLTAAHCTSFGGQAPNFVKLGDINLNIREGVVATQRFQIDTIYVHPEYKSDLFYHDIALLKLSKSAVFTRHVHPIRIWQHRDIPYLKSFAMGYGATQFGRVPTGVLSFLNFTLIGNKECNQSLSNMPETPYGIIDSQICAVNSINSADICQGDSGGPLQLHLPGSERPTYFLIGITSYGLACGTGLPSAYTRVNSYLQWIEDIVWPD